MASNTELYQKVIMARKSKYKAILLRILPADKFLNTSQIIKLIERKEGKQVHYYLVHRVLSELMREGKIEKQTIPLGEKGKQSIFLWRKR
jgi:hypothetical protein